MATRPPNWKIPHPIAIFVPGTSDAQHAGESIVHGVGDVGHGVASAAHGVVSAADATGKFFQALLNPHTWVRIGEVLVGAVLLIVGVDHMFNTNMGGKLAKVAPYAMV